jgi:hypothetical protein
MLREGFEPTTPVFERAKTVHALDCAATVIGRPQELLDLILGHFEYYRNTPKPDWGYIYIYVDVLHKPVCGHFSRVS